MIIACDTESTGLSTFHGHKPFAISICWEDETDAYIDCPVNTKTREPEWNNVSDQHRFNNFCLLLEDNSIEKVFHHAKHDIRMLRSIGINVKGKIHDTSIAARCTNTLELTVALKPLAKKYLDISTDDEQELKKSVLFYRRKGKGLRFNLSDDTEADYWLPKVFDKTNNLCEKYCRLDALRCMKLHQMYQEAMKDFGVYHTYEKELELLHILFEMEDKGLYSNLERINEGIEYCQKRATETEQEIYSKYGSTNLDSPKQLGPYLVEKMGVPIEERTATGLISTGLPTLRKYYDYNQEGLKLLFKRSAYETIRGYYENYFNHYVYGKIHCSIKQFDTSTFRLSVVDPNLQNVANPVTSGGNISYVRDEKPVNARRCFGPEPGTIWLVIDYKQLELRIFASRAGEETLIEVFNSGGDPHNTTRLKCPFLAAMPKEQGRKIAKNTNFTVINVGGAQALYEKYSIPLDQGETVVKEFKIAYPRTKARAYECQHFAEKHGYIVNAYNDKIFTEHGWEYRGTSYDIQSSAARLIKRAMINLAKMFKKKRLNTHLLLQVHDELVIGVPSEEFCDELVIDIKNIMEDNGGAFCVETPVDISIVIESWDQKQEYKSNGSHS